MLAAAHPTLSTANTMGIHGASLAPKLTHNANPTAATVTCMPAVHLSRTGTVGLNKPIPPHEDNGQQHRAHDGQGQEPYTREA